MPNDGARNFADLRIPPLTTRPIDRVVRVVKQIAAYKNWWECLRIRKNEGREIGPRVMVRFRNGLRIIVRPGTPDIFVLWEVFLAGGYGAAEQIIRAAGGPCAVLDLGAHLGSFTLRCARVPGDVHIHSYEPGPENGALLRENLALNPALAAKVRVHAEAVAGRNGESGYEFDQGNPGGSHLTDSGGGVRVVTRAFREVVMACDRPIALVKMDIEGSEYDILDSTEADVWERIPALLVELHDDPAGRSNPVEWLERIAEIGYRYQKQEFFDLLLSKTPL